jgi:hypothetical protein
LLFALVLLLEPPTAISSTSASFAGSYFLTGAFLAGAFLGGGALGSGFFSAFSGLSYLLGFTFYADSLTLVSF